MTKGELIAALAELADDQEVVVADQNGQEVDIDSAAIEDTGVLYITDDYILAEAE